MSFPSQIFKSYDIRGEVGTELTNDIAERVGRALADWLPTDGPVAVGYDMRPDSLELAQALMQGLIKQGRDVVSIGNVASDMIYFATGALQTAGGAMVTASHNPGNDNGIKLCQREARAIGLETGLSAIRDLAEQNQFEDAATAGGITEKTVLEGWIDHALGFVEPENWPAYNVVIDAGNGMAGAVIPALDGKVPLKIDPMYFELDGTFPNHIANPLVPENLLDIQARIRETKADFGIAFDGDGDRAVVIDENGDPLSGTITTALMARYFLEKNPGANILYNAICGQVVTDVITEYKGNGFRTKVGHSNIKADMVTHNGLFAGEHSGHYFFKDNWNADSGLIAALIVIQVLAESGGSMSQLAADYRSRYVAINETNFKVDDKDKTLNDIKQAFTDGKIDELDGVTVNFEGAWINVRPSNTEPLIRLNAEAKTAARLNELVARATDIINR